MNNVNVLSVLKLNGKKVGLLPPRERVFALEAAIRNLPHKVELLLNHHFCNGMYLREMFIPQGCVLTGHIHKAEHFVICLGDISVYDENGLKRLKGYNVFTSPPGIKRAGYAHEDTFFTGVFKMSNPDERDINKLEEEFVCHDYVVYDKYLEQIGRLN